MSTIITDRLQVDGLDYAIGTFPLDALLATLPERPVAVPTPWRQNGYVADWAIVDDVLVLTKVSREPFARLFGRLFADATGPVRARWFSGFICGWRGDRRRTGYPPRTFYDDEIVFEVEAGRVTRAWKLDLRGVPDQTDEELRLSLPAFLWPARLRDGPGTSS